MKPLPDAVNAGAWLLGETAFTTLRTHRGLALLWEAHLTRLSTTCAFLGLPVPEGERPPLDPLPWGLLRLTVTPEGTFWSHRPLHPGPRPAQGVTVRVTGVQVHPQLAAHKTGSALPYRLAGREAAQAGAFEGWLLDAAGNVADGSRTSPLLELGGRLVVPVGGLPGVTRAAFLAGAAFTEQSVPQTALPHVTRAWLCGSGVGVVPVRAIVTAGGSWPLPVAWPPALPPALVWPEDPV